MLPYISSSTFTPSASDSARSIPASGDERSLSHAQTVFSLTPSLAASARCEMPSRVRNFFMFFETLFIVAASFNVIL